LTDLVRRARLGDDAAFDELYERHVGRVYALCVRLTADPARAEELTQDVFIRAWRKIESFRGESEFSSWLHRLTVNLVLDRQRAEGRARARTRPLDVMLAPAASGPEGARWVDLERAIARLPERARVALVLYAVEGYAYREIAEAMGIAIGSVKAHIHRARTLLLEDLDR